MEGIHDPLVDDTLDEAEYVLYHTRLIEVIEFLLLLQAEQLLQVDHKLFIHLLLLVRSLWLHHQVLQTMLLFLFFLNNMIITITANLPDEYENILADQKNYPVKIPKVIHHESSTINVV